MIESPCVNFCPLDARSATCLGCGRTVAEIARWGTMNAVERARVMAKLRGRLAGACAEDAGSAG